MNSYVTGAIIKTLRENKNLTQMQLANILNVSDKSVSKWETGKGYPDITLLSSIANALDVSIMELLSGECIENKNRSFNILRSLFYVCPVCGNVIFSTGETLACCHGITLPPLEVEENDARHEIKIETVEDEYFVSVNHEMTKDHYISFLAALTDNGVQIIKLYPEGNAETRFKKNRTQFIYAYCNRHGLYRVKV